MNRIDELRAKYEAAEEALGALRAELEEAEEEKAKEDIKNIESMIPEYEKRLKRLKTFIDAFLEDERGSHVDCAFRKRDDPYLDDYHEVMHDPLDWQLVEYDLLGMSKIMEIKFDYYTEVVRDFVTKWIKENFHSGDGWTHQVRIVESKELHR